MNDNSMVIPLGNLLIAFIPALIGIAICFKWSMNGRRASIGVARMLVQLMLIGYLLTFIFGTDSAWLVFAILAVMIGASSWIAMGSFKTSGLRTFAFIIVSIVVGGFSTLMLVTQGVLSLEPWYSPRFMIPLAGMIFANCMTTISLVGERLQSELSHEDDFATARATAFNAALIPNINSMMAVGLVSLPGMMTGQILSGVSPLIAVRYQVMVMCMIFGAASIAAAVFLALVNWDRRIQRPKPI